MELFKETIIEIVKQEDESLDDNLFLELESDADHIENLIIERNNEYIDVVQYYTDISSFMSNPAIRFKVKEDGDWIPIQYQDDRVHKAFHDREGLNIDSFLELWEKHLREWFVTSNSS